MTCGPCARRRKALLAKKKQKQDQGKQVQAAALGAVLAVTQVAGKVMGIHGEVGDGNQRLSNARDERGSQGAESDR